MSSGMSLAPGAGVSPRWLREDETDSISWERGQDIRLENLLATLVMTVGDRVRERMEAAAGCPSTAIGALQWVGRCPGLGSGRGRLPRLKHVARPATRTLRRTWDVLVDRSRSCRGPSK